MILDALIITEERKILFDILPGGSCARHGTSALA